MKTLIALHGLVVPITVLLCLLAPLVTGRVRAAAPAGQCLVYVGTYTGAKSKGIYSFLLDMATGKLTALGLVADTVHPTFLALHPTRRFLYAANEIGNYNGTASGSISAFAIDSESGKLTLLNREPSGGGGPCHLIVDSTGKSVIVANYGGGSIEVLPVQPDGQLGKPTTFIQHRGSSVNKKRQEGPHAHGVALDAANRFACVTDLGLDQVLLYRLDAEKSTLTAHDPPSVAAKPGAGPRHLVFHPQGRFAYAINELDSTMTAYSYDASRGILKAMQTVNTLPPEFTGPNSTAEVAVHPAGRFLYGSNRGHDSIAIFRIDAGDGRLRLVGHEPTQGKTPRNFAIDPSGAWLLAANQDSDSVRVFRIDTDTGRLKSTGDVVEVGAPVCVQFVPGQGQ